MKIIITILSFIIGFSAISANAIEISIAYENKEQPPYYMGNTTAVFLEKPGIAVEMIKMLENEIHGLKIHLKRLPWKRCIFELKKNNIDGIFNASYKKSRLKIGWFPTRDKTRSGQVDASKRITTITYSLYCLKGKAPGWSGNNYEIFKGKIGAPLGYSIVGDLQKKGVEVEEAPSTKHNLNKLLKKRIIAAALQNVTGDSILKADPGIFRDIVKVQPPLATKHYYLMLSDKFVTENPEISQEIWNKIGNIRTNKYDAIAAKYSDL